MADDLVNELLRVNIMRVVRYLLAFSLGMAVGLNVPKHHIAPPNGGAGEVTSIVVMGTGGASKPDPSSVVIAGGGWAGGGYSGGSGGSGGSMPCYRVSPTATVCGGQQPPGSTPIYSGDPAVITTY